MRRNWGGEYENVLLAIAVNENGYPEVLGAAEDMKGDNANWVRFLRWLKGCGLDGIKIIIGDKCLGMFEAVGEVFPDAKYQRSVVHFYHNVFSVVPKSKMKLVAKCSRKSMPRRARNGQRKGEGVSELRKMKLKEASKIVKDGIEKILAYVDFPSGHWTHILINKRH